MQTSGPVIGHKTIIVAYKLKDSFSCGAKASLFADFPQFWRKSALETIGPRFNEAVDCKEFNLVA